MANFGHAVRHRIKKLYFPRKESDLQRAIVQVLSYAGWLVMHIPNQSTRGRQRWAGLLPGAPDLVAVKRGRVVFLEVKTEKGKVSEKQSEVHDLLRLHGMEVRVVRGIDDIADLIQL
jgi:Holliday junction resolvase